MNHSGSDICNMSMSIVIDPANLLASSFFIGTRQLIIDVFEKFSLIIWGSAKIAFDTVWIDGLLYKLFNDFGIKGRMWLAIKDLYTDVKAQVLYSGELSREFDVSQGTGQGRIFAPFMYTAYINSLLQKLSNHCYAISIDSLSLPALSFADDVTLLALFPSFLKTFLNICHQYSVTWRYEFNHTKSIHIWRK